MNDNERYHDYKWLDDIHKEPYGPKEKTTVKKVMLPISLIIKIIKRLFK